MTTADIFVELHYLLSLMLRCCAVGIIRA